MKIKADIRYVRFQNVNGRVVAFAQLFHEDGTKLFPPERAVDAPLAQVLEHVEDKDIVVENAQEVLDSLIRVNRFAS